jgi:hypothetical protein
VGNGGSNSALDMGMGFAVANKIGGSTEQTQASRAPAVTG